MNLEGSGKQKRAKLVRGEHGEISLGRDDDIGDIWAQQDRIRQQRELEEQKKRLARKKLKKQKGLVGLAKVESTRALSRARQELLGTDGVNKAKNSKAKSSNSAHPTREQGRVVEVNLALPSFLRGWRRVFPRLSKKIYVSLAVVILVAVTGGYYLHHRGSNKTQEAKPGSSANSSSIALPHETPGFNTVVPKEKSIDQLGGWVRVSPAGTTPVYAFADNINTVTINVSEQALPDNLKTDAELSKMAEGFGANKSFKVGDITVYIGTSGKGPQSVIFSTKSLLVLIKSASEIPNDSWIAYINSLQ